MSYGDKIVLNNIRGMVIDYEKPSEKSFNDNWIKVKFINENHICYTLEFKNRKEWFKFTRRIKRLNQEIKIKNPERLSKINDYLNDNHIPHID